MSIVERRGIIGSIACYRHHLAMFLKHGHQSLFVCRTGTAHHTDILCAFIGFLIRETLPLFARYHLFLKRSHLAIRPYTCIVFLEDAYLLAYLESSSCRVARHHLDFYTSLSALLHCCGNLLAQRIGNGNDGLQSHLTVFCLLIGKG